MTFSDLPGMMAMGYLSARFDNSASMHWLAQSVNLVGNGALLWGVVLLHRAGFRTAGKDCENTSAL